MARRRSVTVTGPSHDEIIRWYREELAKPAKLPWARRKLKPVALGPTWQVRRGKWVLPERTLGWDVLAWSGAWYQHEPGKPWRYTLEQARFVLWWYAIDESGTFVFRDGVLQRLKGWGKDPLGACLCGVEAFGPCRFGEWENDEPVAVDVPNAWVQTAAVSLEQTKNTMRLFPVLFTAEAIRRFRIQIGKELIHGLGDTRLIQAVTSSPRTLEGNRGTFVLKNETHHWVSSNQGHEMAEVVERNTVKSPDGSARALAITNAYEPSEDSTAQRDREAWEQSEAGQSLTTGILYDSLEAPPEAPLSAEAAPAVVEVIRGDSTWLVTTRIVQSILDTRNPPSQSRRWWYNQIWAAEDAWIVPADFELCVDSDRQIRAGEDAVLFFDGSKSDDATALVACCVSDGHIVTLGMWQRPPGERGKEWTAPRALVDNEVEEAFAKLNVRAFFGDPSHALEDETHERYWDGLFDEWHRRYRDTLDVWAVPGKQGHAVMWDMVDPARVKQFTAAAERCADDIETTAHARRADANVPRSLTWDGDPRLRVHARNARRYPNRYGVSLWKGHRESQRKVDLAVCMVGARMVRRLVLNAKPAKKRSGKVW